MLLIMNAYRTNPMDLPHDVVMKCGVYRFVYPLFKEIPSHDIVIITWIHIVYPRNVALSNG